MKKLLVVLMAAMMVLSMAAVSMAAITMNGDSTFTYDSSIEPSETKENTKLDLNLYFKNKINETVDWTLRYSMTSDTVKLREAYTNVALGDGSLRFGLWEYKPYTSIGILADGGDSAIGRITDVLAVAYTSPELFPGFKAGLAYFIDENANWDAGKSEWVKQWGSQQEIGEGAYIVSFNYKAGIVSADLFYVDTAIDGYEPGYALSAKVNPIDPLTVGLNYGTRPGVKDAQLEAMILELQYKQGPFYAKYGTDLDDSAENVRPNYAGSAYSVGYALENGITLEYRSKDKKKDADPSQELRIIFKW